MWDEETLDYAVLRRDVARAVARLCPKWIADRRDDLVQMTLMRIMRLTESRPTSAEGNRVVSASYLYKAAYSVLVDELRRLRRRRESDLDEERLALAASAAEDPERSTASREVGHAIRECLKAMARDRRRAVTLHLQGHSVRDAARILDWTVKRTENLVYRGLANLRDCLTARGMRP